jgi:cytochrome P450
MAEPSIPPGFDFTDPDLYANRVPADELAELRRTTPVWWNAQPRGASGFDDEGYWVVTKHVDVLEVSRLSDLYSSEEKTAIIRHAQTVTQESLDMQRLILLNLDPPVHTKLRGIVSRGFTPRAIGRLREALTARAERIVQTALAEGTGDFVTDVAAELPLQAIAELLGIPQPDRGKIFAWSNEMIGYDDPEYGGRARRLRHGHGGGPAGLPPGRHRHQAGPRPGRRRPAVGGRVRLLRDPAVRGGQRDHPERDLARDAGLPGPPGPVGAVPGGAASDRGR